MLHTTKSIINTYLILLMLSTLSASLIWGINTLFLLDAGLSNTEAFAANAFFTAGMVIFEIPTGIVADIWGRRRSYILGTLSLSVFTFAYYVMWTHQAPLWQWGVVSVLLGLGFTFFSGATEAWLVDALKATGYTESLEKVFAKGQIISGIAMLSGSVAGGFIAQATSLGVPFLVRASLLGVTFFVALVLMHDIGFTREEGIRPVTHIKRIFSNSVTYGIHNRPVRWLMFAAPFASGVGIYVFYALQPYLLDLYGDPQAYGIAGLAAAIVAGAQIGGGLAVPYFRKIFKKRTSILIAGTLLASGSLLVLGLQHNFWFALGLLILWAVVFAAVTPVRQAYINELIPSKQRATVLSFDSLMGSLGGVFVQPALGRTADAFSYGTSLIFAAVIQATSLPFIVLARREKAPSDPIVKS